jgi:hypothetical protein
LDQLEGIDFSILNELPVVMILNHLPFPYNIFVKTLTSKESLPSLEELKTSIVKLRIEDQTRC